MTSPLAILSPLLTGRRGNAARLGGRNDDGLAFDIAEIACLAGGRGQPVVLEVEGRNGEAHDENGNELFHGWRALMMRSASWRARASRLMGSAPMGTKTLFQMAPRKMGPIGI